MSLFELNLNGAKYNEIELSCESSAILSLIDYCNLKINKDFKCFFYYDSNTRDEQTLIEILNSKFQNYKFLPDDFINKADQNLIYVRKINENQNVNDTNLPSLIKQLNDHLTITITGLASVFRIIVKETQKSTPNCNINYLLV